MAVKNYGIHDKWTDLDKLNNIDIKSVDGVIVSVKINGEEAGGGGDSSKVISVNTEELEPNVAYRADKTVAEISQAMNEGKMVFVDMGNKTYIVTHCNTVIKKIEASLVTFNTTSIETSCVVETNTSATAQFSSTDDYPVFVQQSV